MFLKIVNALIRLFEILLVSPILLPFKFYKNSILSLAEFHDVETNKNKEIKLYSDFPLLTYITEFYDAIIVLSYPIGLFISFYISTKTNFEFAQNNRFNFSLFFITIIITYLVPVILTLPKEILNLSLKTVNYLKNISSKD